MDSIRERFCSIESEDFKRKGPFKDRIITMIVITKIGIDSTGKHNLH